MAFIKDALVKFNGNRLTDHNRSALEISTERLEQTVRTANGTLRKWHVADKRSFNMSWDMLPSQTTKTVDGYWGGQAIKDFYDSTTGSFSLSVMERSGTATVYTVVFTDFSYSVVKRYNSEYWNVNVSCEQI